jgi:hypothetical protein
MPSYMSRESASNTNSFLEEAAVFLQHPDKNDSMMLGRKISFSLKGEPNGVSEGADV